MVFRSLLLVFLESSYPSGWHFKTLRTSWWNVFISFSCIISLMSPDKLTASFSEGFSSALSSFYFRLLLRLRERERVFVQGGERKSLLQHGLTGSWWRINQVLTVRVSVNTLFTLQQITNAHQSVISGCRQLAPALQHVCGSCIHHLFSSANSRRKEPMVGRKSEEFNLVTSWDEELPALWGFGGKFITGIQFPHRQ